MCLHVRNKKLKTAEEDIIVYKRLVEIITIEELKKCHGKPFNGVIYGTKCEGKISIDDSRSYICTDLSDLDGLSCEEKFGYKYSWNIGGHLGNGFSFLKFELNIDFNDVNVQIATPYQGSIINIGETYSSELKLENDSNVNIGLHSFAELESAKDDGCGDGIFAKCIIPKGAHYYEGIFCNRKSYASDRLTYVELIKN